MPVEITIGAGFVRRNIMKGIIIGKSENVIFLILIEL